MVLTYPPSIGSWRSPIAHHSTSTTIDPIDRDDRAAGAPGQIGCAGQMVRQC